MPTLIIYYVLFSFTFKSNINKQHVKVNVNTGGSIPSGISHMNLPAYPNLTDINSTIKGTFNDVLNDFLKTQSQPKSQQSQQQPHIVVIIHLLLLIIIVHNLEKFLIILVVKINKKIQ